jgi:hypothetical protein
MKGKDIFEKYLILIANQENEPDFTLIKKRFEITPEILALGNSLSLYLFGRSVLGKNLDQNEIESKDTCLKLETTRGKVIVLTLNDSKPIFFYDPIEIIEKPNVRQLIASDQSEFSEVFKTIMYKSISIGYSILFKVLDSLPVNRIPVLTGTLLKILELGGYFCPLLSFEINMDAINLDEFYNKNYRFNLNNLNYFCLRTFKKLSSEGILARGEHMNFIKAKSKATSLFEQFERINKSRTVDSLKYEIDELVKLISKNFLNKIDIEQTETTEAHELGLEPKINAIISDNTNLEELKQLIESCGIESLRAKAIIRDYIENKLGKPYNNVTFTLQYKNIASKIQANYSGFDLVFD